MFIYFQKLMFASVRQQELGPAPRGEKVVPLDWWIEMYSTIWLRIWLIDWLMEATVQFDQFYPRPSIMRIRNQITFHFQGQYMSRLSVRMYCSIQLQSKLGLKDWA